MKLLAKSSTARLLVSAIYNDRTILEKALDALEKQFGRIDAETEESEFLHTRAYVEEMGEGLKRRFFSFVKPINPANLAGAKELTSKIETKLADRVSNLDFRKVNIDPIMLGSTGLTLATKKDATYRICIGKEIYAEKTLALVGRKFMPFPWTHPDYMEPDVQEFLEYTLAGIETFPSEFAKHISMNMF